MKTTSKSSLKKKGDIYLQHKNRASNKFSKKKLLHLAENRAGAERVNRKCSWKKSRGALYNQNMNIENYISYVAAAASAF